MLKITLYAILIIIIIGLMLSGYHLYKVAQKNNTEMSQYTTPPKKIKKHGRILVVYYSLSGNTKHIAELIKKHHPADLYEITLKEPLSPSPQLYFKIKNDLKHQEYPEIAGKLPDFTKYDLIILGSPVWWYTVSTPILGLLQKTDFINKPVAIYTTQGSNSGTFLLDVKQNIQHADIVSYKEFNNLSQKYESNLSNKVAHWLNQIK